MEEDIKILEDYIEWVKKEGIEVCGMVEELPALENLLKVHQELQDEYFWQQVRIRNDYIPKSKVKEKIEELKETLNHYGDSNKLNLLEKVNVDLIDARIQVLQELLEEESI